jgi:hypothetical protein
VTTTATTVTEVVYRWDGAVSLELAEEGRTKRGFDKHSCSLIPPTHVTLSLAPTTAAMTPPPQPPATIGGKSDKAFQFLGFAMTNFRNINGDTDTDAEARDFSNSRRCDKCHSREKKKETQQQQQQPQQYHHNDDGDDDDDDATAAPA